ncbi:MAG: hypothetical protein LBC43_04005 [Bifidobacteriaceae bacterium]|jgi:hypothetical protein|nr:hypothetical protein [Bifidobacteriaceae bacterium]
MSEESLSKLGDSDNEPIHEPLNSSLLNDLADISVTDENEIDLPTFSPESKQTSADQNASNGGLIVDPTITAQNEPTPEKSNRNLVIILSCSIAAFLIAAAAFLLWVWPGFISNSESSSTSPVLTPVTPIENTDLANAIPKFDGVFTMIEQTIGNSWSAQDPIHQYQMLYQDKDSAEATSFEVIVGQWKSTIEAKKAFANLLPASIESTASGDTVVDGAVQGQYVQFLDSADPASGYVLWQNGNVVVQARGPKDLIFNFYEGYGL